MLATLRKPDNVYYDLYEGRTLLVKVSGKEIASPESLNRIVDAIRSFVRNGIQVVFVYGGGVQIDREWNAKHPGEPRPKVDGVGLVDQQIMEEAVIPAWQGIDTVLREVFPDAGFVSQAQLVSKITDAGGDYSEAELLDIQVDLREALSREPLQIIGFVGADPEAHARGEYANTNINADAVVSHISAKCHDFIDEVLLVTETGGVQDIDGKVVPLLTKSAIVQILAGEHLKIKATGGMLKKLQEALAMLENVDKVAIIGSSGVQKEIEYWAGSGTLCVNEDKGTFSQASEHELSVFDQVYTDLAAKGIFRQRSAEELAVLKAHHHVLRIQNSPLAGISLVPVDDEWSEFSALWSGYLKNGIGTMLITRIKELIASSGKKVFALTNSDGGKRFFERAGFVCHGSITEVQAAPPFSLPKPLRDYQVAGGRDPSFVYTFEATP